MALPLNVTSAMGILWRQRYGDDFIYPRESPVAGVLPILPTRLAARALRVLFSIAAGMGCGLAFSGAQGGFQFFGQPLNFSIEPLPPD